MSTSPVSPDTVERAAAIVAGLPLADRIRLVSGRDFWTTEAVPAQVPSVLLADGPHGLRKQVGHSDQAGPSDTIPATCFPTAATLACSWDQELLTEIGRALGREARAEDVAVLLGPGLNLKRHPRGGRSFEYFSEDPYLSGMLAAAMVRGIQSVGVAACPKHFAANNQETNRMVIDTIIDERTLRELYLRGFEIVVQESGPYAVMTAYNQVNGQFCSDSTALLRDVLRAEWGFEGLAVSDWGGTNDRTAGLAAGMDLEMPGGAATFDVEVAEAIESGALAEADLDRSAARVVAMALDWAERRKEPIGVPELEDHHALARRAAAASTVLLTNDGLLPLAGTGTIAVIGAFAASPRIQGEGSSRVRPTGVDSLLESLTDLTAGQAHIRFAAGYDVRSGQTTPRLLADAATAAHDADHVILVLGLPESAESEAIDRPDCLLPEGMDHLREVIMAVHPRPAVVLMNGGPLELPWSDRPAALVEAHLAGQAGGSALADVLLGRAEPGGRLAESVPMAVADLPADRNFPGAPRQVEYREGFHVGYRFHDTAGVPARFPFGHGLGYTSFALSAIEVSGSGCELTVAVDVTNTGQRPGSQVVQIYVGDVEAGVARPAKELVGYAKVHLTPGETQPVRVRLDRRAFAVWDVRAHDWLVEAGEFEILVGTSSTDIHDQVTVQVESDDQVQPVPGTAGTVATDAEFAALLGRPLPIPAGSTPYTRNSTPPELAESPVGRALVALMEKAAGRNVVNEPEDGGAAGLRRAVLAGMPARGFVQWSNGRLSLRTLDRVLRALNSDVRGAVGRRRK